jgi:hypothetical protein
MYDVRMYGVQDVRCSGCIVFEVYDVRDGMLVVSGVLSFISNYNSCDGLLSIASAALAAPCTHSAPTAAKIPPVTRLFAWTIASIAD